MTDGIICIDKPQGHTSFDVIARMRGILKTKKLGHAGTLDPMATGVLPVFVGRATKACDLLPNQDKRYTASFRLGLVTDTQDITGTVLEERPVAVGEADIRRVCAQYSGPQRQVPPMYSAVKVGGKRLYDLAREGKEVERAARDIVIYELNVLGIEKDTVTIDVFCSKGTYIRTLCHDIGQELGCGATLTELRRTEAAGFKLGDCLTLEQLTEAVAAGEVEQHIRPVAAVFASLPGIELSEKQAHLYQNGVKLEGARLGLDTVQGDIAVYGPDGELLGVSWLDEVGQLRLRKLFLLSEEKK